MLLTARFYQDGQLFKRDILVDVDQLMAQKDIFAPIAEACAIMRRETRHASHYFEITRSEWARISGTEQWRATATYLGNGDPNDVANFAAMLGIAHYLVREDP